MDSAECKTPDSFEANCVHKSISAFALRLDVIILYLKHSLSLETDLAFRECIKKSQQLRANTSE